jgi:fructokinase
MMTSLRIGIDVGGTKIEAIALEANGTIRLRRRVAAPHGDYDATLHAIAGLASGFMRELQAPCTIGVGVPGALSPATGLIKNANSVWLIGKPIDRDLEHLLGQPIRVSNDANCFALSEATDGAGAGAAAVFGVIVGTGTGGGLVVHGRVLEGRHRIAGEWGHNPIPWPERDEWPGPTCYCGRTGCIETFLSGPGLARAYHLRTAQAADPAEIARRASLGEPAASQVLGRYEQRMARALASIINVVDPDVIVLGGGLSRIDRLYAHVPPLWGPFVFSDRATTPLVRAVHGDASGVRGAAWLWAEDALPRSSV